MLLDSRLCTRVIIFCLIYKAQLSINFSDEGRVVFRALCAAEMDFGVESFAQLEAPLARSFYNSNTLEWPLKHTQMNLQYFASMAVLPFALGSVSLPSTSGGKSATSNIEVLAIGLGGGTTKFVY